MNFKNFYKTYLENDFKLEHPRSDVWYKTFDAFFPDANKREEELPKYHDYDDWTNYLDFEDSIELDQMEGFVNKFGLKSFLYMEGSYLNIRDDKNSYWLEKSDDSYDKIEDSDDEMKNNYIPGLQDHEKLNDMRITEDDLYIDGWETTIGELRKNPGLVYHYTNEDNLKKIKKTKELRPSFGSGLTNRNAHGIFCSVSPDTYADGVYGDILLEIDLNSFKESEGLTKLDLEPEPDILESSINATFAHKLGFVDYSEYVSDDMSSETIIVGHVIPIKYIRIL